MLLADGSPSELPSHSESVQALAEAYKAVKADHPGQGNGPTEKGDDDEGDDSDSDDDDDDDHDDDDHDDDDHDDDDGDDGDDD